MSKKRNKYFFKEKAVIRLRMEDNDIRDAIRNQGLVELDEPIHHGYNAEWILRKDYARREDAAVYQEALDACKGKVWSRTPEFKYKNGKTKRWEKYLPALHKINKEKYEALSPSAKKFFFECTEKKKYWKYGFNDKEYRCTLSYELVVLVSKSFITHRREHDNILYQMDAENEKMLRIVTNGAPYPGSYHNKFWRKHENKKEKLKAEREVVEVKKAYKGLNSITHKNVLLDI